MMAGPLKPLRRGKKLVAFLDSFSTRGLLTIRTSINVRCRENAVLCPSGAGIRQPDPEYALAKKAGIYQGRKPSLTPVEATEIRMRACALCVHLRHTGTTRFWRTGPEKRRSAGHPVVLYALANSMTLAHIRGVIIERNVNIRNMGYLPRLLPGYLR